MAKHSEQIWRTVVFAGAMLGSPLISADSKPAKPVQPAPKADTADTVVKELAAVDKSIKADIDAVTAAQNQADRDAAKAKLDAHKKQKTELEKKLAELKKTPLGALEVELAAKDVELEAAIAALTAAQNDASRNAANTKLAALRKDKAQIEKKIAVEREKLARPRTPPENERPIGRGFILS